MVRIPALKRFEAVRVEWIDSAGAAHGWSKLRKKDRAVEGCVTVGMVECQTPKAVTLVLSWDSISHHANGAITIPIIAITKLQRLT